MPGARLHWQLVAGPVLLALAWPAYWTVADQYSEDLFLPLWLGYLITVDGLVRLRTGTSLLTGRPRLFLLLFPVSCAFWFCYELYNHVLQNWHYQAHQRHPRLLWDLVQGVLITTVIPVLWETRDFFRSFPRLAGLRGVRLPLTDRGPRIVAAAGLLSLTVPLLLPRQTYPLLWCGFVLLLDPVNLWTGRPSLLGQLAHGRWGELVVLSLAGLTSGFFWEMWNGGSAGYRWVYDTPYVNSWPHLFEMPLPGYLGYPPLAFSAYAVTVLLLPTAADPALA
ncbi:hypothetical protein [Kitasatospora azatica]|uniref:hypothetical protein n=1 Tax=Kitasatospora azatica TaxID=58347 RepID=UPI0005696176|nr:hypothetical protein [Kitasatospora azatica]